MSAAQSSTPQFPNTVRFDTIEVGQSLGPVTHHVTAEMIRAYTESTGDLHPDYLGAAPIAPPAMATIFSTRLMGRVGIDRPSGGIHAKQEYEFLAPLRAGQTVTTTGRVVEKTVRRGRNYVVYEALSVDESGRAIARCRVTQIFAASA